MTYIAVNKDNSFHIFDSIPERVGDKWLLNNFEGLEVNPNFLATFIQDLEWEDMPTEISKNELKKL